MLFCLGMNLDEKRYHTMRDLELPSGIPLKLIGSITIFVKTLTGKTIEIKDIQLTYLVERIKE